MIKTYEDWENSLDQNYVRQLSPDAWDLTGSAFEAGQQSQQAKIDELQAIVYGALNMLCKLQHSSSERIYNDVGNILKGNKDEK